jgi:hypothetical protein
MDGSKAELSVFRNSNMPTLNEFLIAYRTEMKGMYTWAVHQDMLEEFMGTVVATINGTSIKWSFSGTAAANAWKAVGMEGEVTLEALRALPN